MQQWYLRSLLQQCDPRLLLKKKFLQSLKVTDHSDNLDVDGRIVFKWVLGKQWEGID
jgi:hypothetical protein